MQQFRWMVVGAVLALAGSGTALAGSMGSAAGVAPTCSAAALQGTYGIHGIWFLRDTESRHGPDLPDADDATFSTNGFLERM
jgi:hypothetical protein